MTIPAERKGVASISEGASLAQDSLDYQGPVMPRPGGRGNSLRLLFLHKIFGAKLGLVMTPLITRWENAAEPKQDKGSFMSDPRECLLSDLKRGVGLQEEFINYLSWEWVRAQKELTKS